MATILIVDDRPTNRQFLTTLLGYGGHRLLEAGDGVEALRLVKTERPDLVISDILMPTMDGFEFAKGVRADPDIAATKIVFYTATYRATEAALLAKACGVTAVIAKPAEPQRVLDVVYEQLGIVSPKSIPRTAPKPAGDGERDEVQLSQLGVQITDYVNNIRSLKSQLDGLVERGLELEQERERLRGISTKFAQNVAELHSLSSRRYTLVELAMDLMSERDPQRMLNVFIGAARRLLGAQTAVAFILRPTEDLVHLIATEGLGASATRAMDALQLGSGVMERLLDTRNVIRTAAAPEAASVDGLPDGHPPAKTFLGMTIGSHSGCYGVAFFTNKLGAEAFDDKDERMALALGSVLGAMYENFELYNMLQHHAAELKLEVGRRDEAQKALAQSERALTRAQVMAKLGHVITGPDGDFESWSDTVPELVGIGLDSMPASAREWLDMVHADDRERFRASMIQAATTGQRVQIEYRLRRGDGAWADIRQFIEPLPEDAAGAERVKRWFSTLQDITEQKSSESKLRESELRFRQLAENIRSVFFLVDARTNKTLYLSPVFEEIWGRSRESVYTNTDAWTDAIHPDDRAATYESYRKGMSAGRSEYGYRIVRPDGSMRWIEARAFPVRDGDDKIVRIAGIAEDVTERKNAADQLRESDRRFSSLLSSIQLVSLMLDREARITYCNDYLLKLTGWRREEILGRNWFEVFTPPENVALRNIFAALIADQPEARHLENEILTKSGDRRLITWSNTVLRSGAGEVIGTASIGEDITERKLAETRIKRLNRVYAVLSGINTLIVRVRYREELFREACRVAVEQGGFCMAWIGLVDQEAMQVKPVASSGAVGNFFESAPLAILETRPGGHGLSGRAVRELKPVISNDMLRDKQRLMRKELQERGINSLAVLPLIVGGEALGVFALYSTEIGFFDEEEMKLLLELAGDVSFALEHIAKSEKLDYLAYYDELTGLANRKLFNERLEQTMAHAGRGGRVALFVIDVERFKQINDTFGRQAGDELLRQLAGRMKQQAGNVARLGRIGADQFATMVADFESEGQLARFTEQRLSEVFGAPFKIGDREVRLSAKVGVALYPENGADPDALYASAEAALKKAKAGGETYLFFAPEMTARVAETLALENKLRGALERDEFVLHYQPKIDLDTRAIVGAEALIRWQSPEQGLVAPGKFIPLMEETGLILEAGSWALRQAARDHRSWVERGLKAPRIAVNVSPIQLRQRDFVGTVERALAEGVSPTAIDLEITESLLMTDIKSNIAKLNALRDLGVNIAIDDFGTGYSSLGYLAKLPVQALKIDRSFIITMLDDPAATTLVSTIISLAHAMRLKVIAEGVDHEEQEKLLRLLRCDEMQGFLFSKPLASEALVALLRAAKPQPVVEIPRVVVESH